MVFASLDDTHGLTQSLPDTIALERWSWEKVGGHSPKQETCSHQSGNANLRPWPTSLWGTTEVRGL